MTVNSFAVQMDTFTTYLKDSFTEISRNQIEHLIIDVRRNGGGDSDLGDSLVTYITDQPFKSMHRTDWKRSQQYTSHLKAHVPRWMRWLPLTYFYSDSEYYKKYAETPIGDICTIIHKEQTPPDNALRFNGEVYVLSGIRSFSSAVIFLTLIKDYNLATIVGEETGGPANHFGELYPFVLPNSKLWMHTSVKHFIRPSGEHTEGGVKPDIPVQVSQKDTVDPVLEKTFELINSAN
jgi:C-terminal processing protease CtpA/Prc